jgi:hypothetical protein
MGSALECLTCRRYKHKHKCGARPDVHTAWCDYPVEDCAACGTRYEKGEFPDGAFEHKPAPVRAREIGELIERDASRTRTSAAERRAKRSEERRKVMNRRVLILLAVSLGAGEAHRIYQVLRTFGIDPRKQAVRADFEELIKLKWLTRHQVPFKKTKAYHSEYQWCYTINPAVEEKIRNAGSEEVRSVQG